MEHFGKKYAEWYDAMYQDKFYDQEVACVQNWLTQYGTGGKRLACIGAGTLNHEIVLSRAGYHISGIDLSPTMVALAQQKIATNQLANITVEVGDMRLFRFAPESYDAALIMFNVIGYCASVDELVQVLTNTRQSLVAGGIVVFDAWFAEAVRLSPPIDRWRKTTSSGIDLYRMTHQTHLAETQQIQLDIEVLALENNTLVDRTQETHLVRYWTMAEISAAAARSGFEVVHTATFPTDQALTETEWTFGAVLKCV